MESELRDAALNSIKQEFEGISAASRVTKELQASIDQALAQRQEVIQQATLLAPTSSNQHAGQGVQFAIPENLARLKMLGLAANSAHAQELMPVIIMSSEEYAQTKQKLKHAAEDMNKIGRGLKAWYDITKDDDRARQFFRARLRIVDQFADGEQMADTKDVLSIDRAELDRIHSLLQSMARELFRGSHSNSREPTRA